MSSESVLDMDAVDEVKTVMSGKFPIMLKYFLEDSAGYIASIHNALATQSAQDMIVPAHTLKSSSRQMGAKSLSVLAKQIEEMARQSGAAGGDSMDAFAPLVGDLDQVFGQTKQAFGSI